MLCLLRLCELKTFDQDHFANTSSLHCEVSRAWLVFQIRLCVCSLHTTVHTNKDTAKWGPTRADISGNCHPSCLPMLPLSTDVCLIFLSKCLLHRNRSITPPTRLWGFLLAGKYSTCFMRSHKIGMVISEEDTNSQMPRILWFILKYYQVSQWHPEVGEYNLNLTIPLQCDITLRPQASEHNLCVLLSCPSCDKLGQG